MRIRGSEAVCTSKHQILKLLACRSDVGRNSDFVKVVEKVITGAMQSPPGRPAGGSHPDGCSPHQSDMACRDVWMRSFVL